MHPGRGAPSLPPASATVGVGDASCSVAAGNGGGLGIARTSSWAPLSASLHLRAPPSLPSRTEPHRHRLVATEPPRHRPRGRPRAAAAAPPPAPAARRGGRTAPLAAAAAAAVLGRLPPHRAPRLARLHQTWRRPAVDGALAHGDAGPSRRRRPGRGRPGEQAAEWRVRSFRQQAASRLDAARDRGGLSAEDAQGIDRLRGGSYEHASRGRVRSASAGTAAGGSRLCARARCVAGSVASRGRRGAAVLNWGFTVSAAATV